MEEIVYAKDHPEFITVTCLEWSHVLADDRFKDIVIDSLRFLNQGDTRFCLRVRVDVKPFSYDMANVRRP